MSLSSFSGQLDLRARGQLDNACIPVYNRIAADIRREYADFVGSLYTDSEYSLDWWLEAPASRNPVFSDLFHQLVSLLLLQRLLDQEALPEKVMVDSNPMKITVLRVIQPYSGKMQVFAPSRCKELVTRTRSILSPFRSMARLLAEWAIIRCSRGLGYRTATNDKPLILVDTFAIPGFVDRDRYYPGLLDHAGSQTESIRFVPQFFNLSLRALFSAARTLRRQPRKFLLKEDYLGLSDMFWCFGHLTRINRVKVTSARFRGIEVKTLVEADTKHRKAFRCALRGLMNYRFARSLSQGQVAVKKTIDWFENHPMDRGWNAGFNAYYPNISRVGYTGFYPAGQSFRPTLHEVESKTLPPEHLVIGQGFFSDFNEFYPQCKVSIAPAFRYSELPKLRDGETNGSRILVALPYYREMCNNLISVLGDIHTTQPHWEFILKPHPAHQLENTSTLEKLLNGNVQISGQSLTYWLERSNVMIAGGQASSILEAAACGVPTVVLASRSPDGEVSIPGAIPGELYCLTENESEVARAIARFLESGQDSRAEWLDLAGSLRESCFTPVTDRTVAQMLAS